MVKIRWTEVERALLLEQVKKEWRRHPTMNTLDLVRMGQKIALPSDRRRTLMGTGQVGWVQRTIDQWNLNGEQYVPNQPKELPPPTPVKPDIMVQLVELLSDAMVQVVAEAIVAARGKLDLPVVDIQSPPEIVSSSTYPVAPCKKLRKIAVYGLFSNQVGDIRSQFKDCFEFRFVKDVSQAKMISAAQWADHFIVMTKFVSHDYEAVKKYGNIRYVNGAASSLITELEEMYLADCK